MSSSLYVQGSIFRAPPPQRLIETVPSARSAPLPQPTLTPLGFANGVLPGNGAPATAYTVSRFILRFLEHYGTGVGILQSNEDLCQQLEELTKFRCREWELSIRAFEKQHDVKIPEFLTNNEVDGLHLRKEAFLEAVQQVSLLQIQPPPRQEGTNYSTIDFSKMA